MTAQPVGALSVEHIGKRIRILSDDIDVTGVLGELAAEGEFRETYGGTRLLEATIVTATLRVGSGRGRDWDVRLAPADRFEVVA